MIFNKYPILISITLFNYHSHPPLIIKYSTLYRLNPVKFSITYKVYQYIN